ncbi:MAG: preprotein translocase subunit SecG [Casimicrobiaceae bacterium]|nr:preprotein translocase subunit SecG [Casimicrobiaceae bacterium]MCX8098203.1 preprotein translocase subunit SecG [Casimicrobiaceae bacterium]MDW8311313.1 preprotein translocase subunit SecG [Burkholderiales bacterium]
MQALFYALLILSSAAIIVLVLLQQGKGADMGAAFGSGSAGSLFGSAGSANFLSRSTAVAATVFFLVCIGLTWLGTRSAATAGGGVMQGVVAPSGDQAGSKAPKATEPKSDVPK